MPRVDRPRPTPRNLLADAAAIASAALLAAVVVLWVLSRKPGGTELALDGPGAQFHVLSRDGRLMVGVFAERPAPRWVYYWNRRSYSPALRELVNNDDAHFAADLFGFGLALPHTLLVALLAVVPTWWLLVHREHVQRLRRQDLGLCRHCGYDVRHSPTRCPECGAPLPPLTFRGNGQALAKAANGAAR